MTTLVRNQRAQPLELHLAGRTIVLAPYGEAEVSAADAAGAQIARLAATGYLSVLTDEPSDPGPGPELAKAARRGPARPGRKP